MIVQENYRNGILFILISCICFASVAALVKQVKHIPVMELVIFRNIPMMIIVPGMIIKDKIPPFGNNKPILILSGLVIAVGTLAGFYAFATLSLTDALTIQQLNPFFTFILAGLFLKEKLHLKQIPLFVLAFMGGLFVIKPGFRIDIFPAMIALLSAFCISCSHATLRHLRLTDNYLIIINYRAYIISLVSLIILLLQKEIVFPNPSDYKYLVLLGFAALIAQVSLTRAYQLAPASLASLYNYSQIIFATIFSLIFFREIPDLFSIAGAALIIISGYLNYHYKTNKKPESFSK